MKTIQRAKAAMWAGIFLAIAAGMTPALAQPFETSLTTSNFAENFDELTPVCAGADLPPGWVIAQGVGLPKYGSTLASAGVTNWTTIAPVNYTNYEWVNEGGASGCTHDISPGGTFGGRINFGDEASGYANRSIGFRSSNPTVECPTNDIMLGFYNNTGSDILSITVTNNIKLYGYNETPAMVYFYYSLDGTNWTTASTGNCGPFPSTNVSQNIFFYTAGPIVSNKSFTISGLNVPNGSPFYLDWQFVISSANGSFSASIGLDDVGLTATLGGAPPPVGNSVWPTGAGNWNAAADWQGGNLPVTGNNLIFDGSGGAMNNNLTAVSTGTGTVGMLVFSNTASGSYTLSGNAVTVTGGISNASPFLQTLNIPLTLTQDEDFTAGTGSLAFGGGISNGGNQVIFAGTTNITVTAPVTGAGNLVMQSFGQLALNASNDYAGQTLLDAGTTMLGNIAAIPSSSAVTVGGGATLNLNGLSPTVPSVSGSGAINLGSGKLGISGGGGAFSGPISGLGGLTMAGTGLQAINSSNNTYQGTTAVTSGILQLANVATLGTGPLNLNGGTLQLASTRDTTNGVLSNEFVLSANSIINNTANAAAGTRNLPFGGTISTTGGTLSIQNISTANSNIMNVRFTAGGINFSQPIFFDDSLAGNPNNNQAQLDCYNSDGSPAQVFGGTISGDGLVRRAFNIAGGGGTTIFTGANTYAPLATSLNPFGTLIAQGIIGFGSSTMTDGGGNILSGPIGTSPLQIDDDAFVGFLAYGGPQIIANAIVLNGVQNTYILGSNSLTLAGPINLGTVTNKMLTVSNTAPTIISGTITNSAELIKAGPGTLILTGDNDYGPTEIVDGALEVDTSDGGSGTGTNELTVTAPGILSGSGLIGSPVSGDGFIEPGPGAAILTMTNGLDLSDGGDYLWNLSGESTVNPGVNFSQIALAGGSLTLGGDSTLTLQFIGSASAPSAMDPFWKTNESWRILSLSGSATAAGNFSSIASGVYAAGTFSTSTDAGGVVLTFTPSSGPVSQPDIAAVTLSGTQLFLVVSNGSPSGVFYVVTSPNVTLPLSAWTPVATNNFSGNGMFTNNLTITPSEIQRYYSIKAN